MEQSNEDILDIHPEEEGFIYENELSKLETSLLIVPLNQVNYDETVRTACAGICPRICPICDKYVPNLREHANARHLPWWLDATSACWICQASCNRPRTMEVHEKLCHEGVDARIPIEDWKEMLISFTFTMTKKLNLPGFRSLFKYVTEEGLALLSPPTMTDREKTFHFQALDAGPYTPYNPCKPNTLQDISHWRVYLNLLWKTEMAGLQASSFMPERGYQFVVGHQKVKRERRERVMREQLAVLGERLRAVTRDPPSARNSESAPTRTREERRWFEDSRRSESEFTPTAMEEKRGRESSASVSRGNDSERAPTRTREERRSFEDSWSSESEYTPTATESSASVSGGNDSERTQARSRQESAVTRRWFEDAQRDPEHTPDNYTGSRREWTRRSDRESGGKSQASVSSVREQRDPEYTPDRTSATVSRPAVSDVETRIHDVDMRVRESLPELRGASPNWQSGEPLRIVIRGSADENRNTWRDRSPLRRVETAMEDKKEILEYFCRLCGRAYSTQGDWNVFPSVCPDCAIGEEIERMQRTVAFLSELRRKYRD